MFYLINKPLDMTSFQVIRILREKTGIKKMGHIGTLDPKATWLMLIATEQSTKLLSYLNSDKKTYRFTVRMDGITESLDLETPIVNLDTSNAHHLDATTIAEKLLAEKSQIPPKYSALHINGQRAYVLARKQRDFDIPSRPISVSDVSVLNVSFPEISVRLSLSAGGYIRSFAPLIARWHNISGGYITALDREALHFWSVTLTKEDAQELDTFDKNQSISEKRLFPDFLTLHSDDDALLSDIKNGVKVHLSGISPREWQYVFLIFPNYGSLLRWQNGEYSIQKNDILSSSHKNHITGLDFF